MKQVDMIALDVLHVSNAQPSELVADTRFTINEAEAEQLEKAGHARREKKVSETPKPATRRKKAAT